MPIDYRIDASERLVVVRGHGVFTEADAFGYQRDITFRPDLAGYDELVDMTDVTEIALRPPTSDLLQILAQRAATMDVTAGTSKVAIVAPSDLAYGLGRMYQAYRGLDNRTTRQLAVFRTLAEALQFLGRDSVEFPASGPT